MAEIKIPDFQTVKIFCPVPAKYRKKITKQVGATGPMWETFHKGTDWAVPLDTPLFAAREGIVVHSSNDGGKEGLYMSIEWLWADNVMMRCLYFHMNRADIRVGKKVVRGQMVGLSGNTGNSSGPHLHLQLQSGQGADRVFYKPELEA